MFDRDIENDHMFYLQTKERVVSWWASFDEQQSKQHACIQVLATFWHMFDDIAPLWELCKIEHSADFVRKVFEEASCSMDENLIEKVEKWIKSLGYDIDEIKEDLS